MGRTAKRTFEQGVEEGRRTSLLFLSLAIDTYPDLPSPSSARLLAEIAVDGDEVHKQLVRFESRIRKLVLTRRQREKPVEEIDAPRTAAI
jgi:hypothetical protein